jgi:hypothetical protein
MRQTYRVLSGLIALAVVVQAMAIAFGFFTVGHDVDNGKVLTKSNIENYSPLGLSIHAFMGFTLIPIMAIVLFIISFFAKGVPQAVKWAGFVLLAVVVQVALAIIAFNAPVVGLLHGLNAFILLGTAAMASRRAMTATPAAATPHEAAAV